MRAYKCIFGFLLMSFLIASATGVSSAGEEYRDVSGHWAEASITYAAEIGWLTGYSDGTYRPSRNITRGEFITLVNKVLGRVPETINDLLFDNMIHWVDNADQGAWYYIAVQEATNSHIPEYKTGRIVPGLLFEYERWLEIADGRD